MNSYKAATSSVESRPGGNNMKFNDCFDVIGHLLADLNLNLEDDVDICLTTDADEDGCHSPSLTIVDIETRESLLTVDLREAVKGIMCGELSYPQVVFAVFSKVCAILEGNDDEVDDEKESSKEACSTPSASACPDAEYGLTDYEINNMILSVYRKGTVPDKVLEKVIHVSIDDDVIGILAIFDEGENLRHFSKECLVNRLGLNPDELIARALRNMSLKWPSEVALITNDVYVVKAPKSPYGATSLLYPNMLNRLFKKLDTDVFYAYPTENEVFVSKNKRFINLVKMANVYPNPLSNEIFVVHKLSNHSVDIKKTI